MPAEDNLATIKAIYEAFGRLHKASVTTRDAGLPPRRGGVASNWGRRAAGIAWTNSSHAAEPRCCYPCEGATPTSLPLQA